MAIQTRGLIKEEIIAGIEEYLKVGILPKLNVAGCNTCDPNTGNWAEHLIATAEYEKLFVSNGFDFKVVNGFYNTNYNKKWLNLITPIVNLKIKLFGKFGIYLAPFIGLQGKIKSNN